MFDYVNKYLPSLFNNVFPFNRDIQTINQTGMFHVVCPVLQINCHYILYLNYGINGKIVHHLHETNANDISNH